MDGIRDSIPQRASLHGLSFSFGFLHESSVVDEKIPWRDDVGHRTIPELEMQKKNSFISDDMLNQLRRHAINKADTHLIRTIYLRDWSGYIWVSREVEFYLLRAETPLRKWRLRCGFTDYKNSDYPDGHFYWQGEHPKIYKIYLYVTQKFEPQANILSEVWSW